MGGLFCFTVLCVFLMLHGVAYSQEGFMFTMSKVLREGDISKTCLTAYYSSGNNRNITVSLMSKDDAAVIVKIDDEYEHGQEKCNEFTVPKAGDYIVMLYNDTDILHDAVDITVDSHSDITLVQTDKPMYKPGQTVKFRILTMKSDQKPRIGKIHAVYIKNPDGSRVKQFLDVDSNGIASLEFQLSKEAKLGMWRVLVFLNGTDQESYEDGYTSFKVKEYVLPRFEIDIIPPKYVLVNDETIEGKVCAKYTYGKDVRGTLDLKICGGSYISIDSNCHTEVVEIDGCYMFEVNTSSLDMGRRMYSYYGWEWRIDASVTEHGTGAEVKDSKKGPPLTMENLKLEFKDYTNGYFKPGLPFNGKVSVTKPDGQVAPGEVIRVSATSNDYNVKFVQTYTSDETGTVNYTLCDIPDNITSLSLMAEAIEYEDTVKFVYTPRANYEVKQWFSPSFSYIQIPRTEDKQKCGSNMTVTIPFTTNSGSSIEFRYQIIARGNVISTGSLQYHNTGLNAMPAKSTSTSDCLLPDHPEPPAIPFETPDLEPNALPPGVDPPPMIPPPPPEDGADIDSDDDNDVDDNDDDDDDIDIEKPPPLPFEPQMAVIDEVGPPELPMLEPIVRSKSISDRMDTVNLDIPIFSNMAPKFTLLIHYILPDGEIVADSMEFQVEPCFDNEVKMTFDKSTTLPGESVNIRLDAEPGSICGVGIVDKSVNILGGNHQITKEIIYEKIAASMKPRHWFDTSYQESKEYCEKRLSKFYDVDENGLTMSRYVDASKAFESSGLLVLTDLNLQTRPCEISIPYFFDSPFPLARGVGIPGPVAVPLESRHVTASKPLDVRSHFPETWLWDLQVIGVNGTVELPQLAPHTVTSWVGNALCMDAEFGVGVSPLQTLTTYQPFFIHLNLPYAAVRGERLPILLTVYNYLDKCINMQLTLDLGEAFEAALNPFRHKEPFCLCEGKSETKRFYATPKEIGYLSIFAKAEIVAGACDDNETSIDLTFAGLSDSVKRQMFVKAEGVTKEYTHTMYMCANVNESAYEDVILPLQENVVKDSQSGDIRIIGDIMGPALNNLNHLVRMPTGCGEQNMVGFTPNIFVLKYLKSTGAMTEKIRDDAIKYMEIGYQRQLNYRHRDGSFSAFGEKDHRGSVWLTAFVVKSFAQAKPYIFIDPVDLHKSVRFLKLSQSENGCFIETGKVISSYMMGGLGKKKSPAALTAYVLIALLEAGVNTTEHAIVSGFKCILQEFEHEHLDIYSVALAAYANVIRDPVSLSSNRFMKVLRTKAKHDGSLKYWSRYGITPPAAGSLYFEAAASAEVEMTAYALLAHLQYYSDVAIQHSHDIVMWLSHQRNPQGGFASTQDTVVGLNALSEFALLAYKSEPTNLNITVSSNDIKKEFRISDKDNTKLLLQSTSINVLPTRMKISAEGDGCALVQAIVRFNKLPQNLELNKPGFHLKIFTRGYRHDIDRCDRRSINIAVGSRGNKRHSSGMSIVMMKMVTSWYPIKDSLKKLKSQFPVLGMKRFEYDEDENVITFYFDELSRRAREFTIDVEQDRELKVSSPKAAEVSVINYYEKDASMIKSYSLKTTCGTKLEIPRRRLPIPFDPLSPIPVLEQRRIDILDISPNVQQRVRLPMPELGAPAPRLTSSDSTGCPVCKKSRVLYNGLSEDVCNSTSVYKAISGRKGNHPLKLKQDLQTSQNNLNTFADYKMSEKCHCHLLEAPAKRVFIINSSSLKGKVLSMDKDTIIMPASRKIERSLRKIIQMCTAA